MTVLSPSAALALNSLCRLSLTLSPPVEIVYAGYGVYESVVRCPATLGCLVCTEIAWSRRNFPQGRVDDIPLNLQLFVDPLVLKCDRETIVSAFLDRYFL